jgi:predicted DNA binding protein
MVTIVKCEIPAEEFALRETLSTLPDVEFEVDRIVESGEDAVMPMLWARGADDEAIDAALADDPSVENAETLASFDDERLYRMEWVTDVAVVVQIITNAHATITDAHGAGGRWYFRVMYPTRESLAETNAFCEDSGLTFDVTAIREMDGDPVGRYGLTEQQYETLTLATEQGYYEIPREVSAADLADELGISHQALSERLRRGTKALVEDTLLIGAQPER